MKKEIVLSDMPLPTTLDGITASWLTDALAFRYPGTEVLETAIMDVMNGTSTKIRVRATYNRAGQDARLPHILIVKGGFEPHSPPMKGMYAREARFYRDVQPFVRMTSPVCYYAGSDPESYQSIVIMEDLVQAGATLCHALEPHTYEQASRRLDAMARYHAATWNSSDLSKDGLFGWIEGRFEGFGRLHNARYLKPDVWRRMITTPRGAAISVVFHDFDGVIGAMEKLGELHRTSPVRSVLHGDAHPGNMYIQSDDVPGFFDCQVIQGPWHYDVTKYMVCSIDSANRKDWERPLLATYLERLRAYGVEPPTFEEAWSAYRHEIIYSLVMFVINETAFQNEAVNTAYTARCNAAALDHGIKEFMR